MRVLSIACFASLVLGCHTSSQPSPHMPAEASAPVSSAPAAPGLSSAQVDAMIRAEWAKEGILPVVAASDGRFLRRAYIDIVGTIPPPEVVQSFAADSAPDKRARLVETLLASPSYAEHWANYWTDTLLGHAPDPIVDRGAFQRWLTERFAANTPWNQLVTELLTAQGQSGVGGPRGYLGMVAASASAAPAASGAPGAGAAAESTDPPVNWFVRYRETPQDMAGTASRVFLGVQIQCAQCHDHKTEKWKQDDFKSFAACFMRTRVEVLDKGKTMGDLKRANVVDIGRPLPRYAKNPDLSPIASAPPKALDGTDLSPGGNVRQALAAWMTAPDNPWFAEAIVNRLWSHFLGRGFVDPIDDIRPSNPVAAPEVLAALAHDFATHGYDLKRLVRLITGTEVYGLSSGARKEASAEPNKLWSRFRLEPLGPEELLNALMDATGVEETLRRSRANVDRIRYLLFTAYTFLFDVDEEFDQTDFEGTVSQALTLLNGRLVGGGSSDFPGSALDKIVSGAGSDADKIVALYLRTVSRAPTAEEVAYFTRYVNEPQPEALAPPASGSPVPSARPLAGRPARVGPKGGAGKKRGLVPDPEALVRMEEKNTRFLDPKRRAYEDVFWALLNSSEFTFNH